MASRWFCKVFGREMGPLDLQDLVQMVRSQTLTQDDPVRREGSDEWIQVREVVGLSPATESRSAEAVSPVSERQSEDVSPPGEAEHVAPSAPRARGFGKRGLVWGGGIALAVVAAVLVTAWWCWRAP